MARASCACIFPDHRLEADATTVRKTAPEISGAVALNFSFVIVGWLKPKAQAHLSVSFPLPAFLALADLRQRRLLAHRVGVELPRLGVGPLAPVDPLRRPRLAVSLALELAPLLGVVPLALVDPAKRHRLAVSLALDLALCVSPARSRLEHFRIHSDRLPVRVLYFPSYRRQFAASLRGPLSARQLAHSLTLLDLFPSYRPYAFHVPA